VVRMDIGPQDGRKVVGKGSGNLSLIGTIWQYSPDHPCRHSALVAGNHSVGTMHVMRSMPAGSGANSSDT
jgi:hypothetical protein